MQTLLEYVTKDNKILIDLLVKERAKCRKRNHSETHHHLDKDIPVFELTNRKQLSRLMPQRRTWVRPKKRETLPNGAIDRKKNAIKALKLTIKRDRGLQKKGKQIPYLEELDAYVEQIRQRMQADELTFASPKLMPMYKDKKKMADGTYQVTCRPLTIYERLDDKIILAATSRYLTNYFDKYLHDNILSYRKAHRYTDNQFRVPDFNEGAQLIKDYHDKHLCQHIYAADCDIKKFYDIIPHTVVRQCFQRMLDQSHLSDEGKQQVMRIINAYLHSYNFYTHVWQTSLQHGEVYDKIRRKLHDKENRNHYQCKWVDELLDLPEEERRQRGVSQGGSLSLLIANIVLNDVDQSVLQQPDDDRLFIRYCDDMILLHTDYDKCCRLMDCYAQSLQAHGLYYHPFQHVSDAKSQSSTSPQFWQIKSHHPFLWGDGEGNSNRYISFLGYEIRRDGRMRLRKDNMKRFEEKFERSYHTLRRYKKKHTPEEFAEHCQEVLERALASIGFYKSLPDHFQQGSQYQHLKKLKAKIADRLG